MAQPLVLAIEPDLRQAAIVKRIIREKVLADVAVVDSLEAAMDAMRTTIPDVLLLSALMSPRDEDELIAHLRTLDHADHLQTHTIPQLASALNPVESRGSRGLLSAFRRKKEPGGAPSGCDPELFAEEIRVFLQQAADKKREADGRPSAPPADTTWRVAHTQKTAAPVAGTDAAAEPESSGSSSWASPFEWKPSNPSSPIAYPESSIPNPESRIANPESRIADPESHIADSESRIADPESRIADPESRIADPESHIADPESRIANPESRIAGPESPAVTLASRPSAESLMSHLRPRTGIPTIETLAATPAQFEAPGQYEDPVLAAAPIEQAIPEPAPVYAGEPLRVPEAAHVPEPVYVAEPAYAADPAPVEPHPIAAPAEDSRTQDSRLGMSDSGLGIQDSRLRMRDSGLGILDQRSAMRERKLGGLASWARAEGRGRESAYGSDDLRGLLTGLAVPSAVVSVGYGRGCRIRRVRVPAAREPHETEAVGAVIISKRLLAEQRGLREQPQA